MNTEVFQPNSLNLFSLYQAWMLVSVLFVIIRSSRLGDLAKTKAE